MILHTYNMHFRNQGPRDIHKEGLSDPRVKVHPQFPSVRDIQMYVTLINTMYGLCGPVLNYSRMFCGIKQRG